MAEGEYLSLFTDQGTSPNRFSYATGRSGLSTTTSAAILSPVFVITAVARLPLFSTFVISVLYLNSTPCFAAAAAKARGTACMPPLGKKTPATESM